MLRLVLFFLTVVHCVNTDEAGKDAVAAGYYSPHQSDASYGYGQFYQPPYPPPPGPPPPYYQPPRLVMPPFALPTYDVAYCSVHASFPLVGAQKDKHHHRDYHHYHHHGHHRLRKFERQSCRYAAAFDSQSCDTCCRIASRTDGFKKEDKEDDIRGLIISFDPDMDFHRHDDQTENRDNRVDQCVCCAPLKY